jgi:aconitase B
MISACTKKCMLTPWCKVIPLHAVCVVESTRSQMILDSSAKSNNAFARVRYLTETWFPSSRMSRMFGVLWIKKKIKAFVFQLHQLLLQE